MRTVTALTATLIAWTMMAPALAQQPVAAPTADPATTLREAARAAREAARTTRDSDMAQTQLRN